MFKATSQGMPFLRALAGGGRRTPGLLVGLQFVQDHMAVARVRVAARGQPTLEHLQCVPAPAGRRDEPVRRLLHTGLLRQARVVVVLAPGQYDTYQVAAPAVPDEELRDAVRWQLRGVLPYPPEEASLDFVRLPQTGEGTAHRPALLVFAARRDVVAQAVAPLETARIEVTAVDVPEMAQRNLAELDPRPGATTCWLAFEADSALLTVHYDADMCFARRITLPAGGAELQERQAIERLCTHVSRSLDLFERQSTLPPVARLTIGPHRFAESLVTAMVDRVGVEVNVFALEAALRAGPALSADALEAATECMPAVGAALRAAAPDGGARRLPLEAVSQFFRGLGRRGGVAAPAAAAVANPPGAAVG